MLWTDFLRRMADDFGLAAAQTEVFLLRFDEAKQTLVESQIENQVKETLGLDINKEAYIKRRSEIYKKFKYTRQNPEGCAEIDYDGPHKFVKLLDWLKAKYADISPPVPVAGLEYPEGLVALNSPFYVERPSVESECYHTIMKPGSLLRIKAPKMMGKTSLMLRICDRALAGGCQAVYLDLGGVELAVFTNLDKFLRWMCAKVGRGLKLDNQLEKYWDAELLSSNDNCTAYFEEYLLPAINSPLVLALDEVDRIFPYPQVAEDFFGMLRSWHEKGKNSTIWQQLRLVVAHSTEVYIPLDINQSPFNVGVPVELRDFDKTQVQALAKRHGLDWGSESAEQLMAVAGGHPHLVRLALYYLSSEGVPLEKLLREAPTEAGIYSNHLRRHLEILQKGSPLADALKKVVTAADAVELESMQIYKLHSMGLVQRQDNGVTPRCNLYRYYFCRVL